MTTQGDLLGAAHLTTADPSKWPVDAGWQPTLDAFWASDKGRGLLAFLAKRLDEGAVVFPPEPMRALALTPLASVRVVIVGQDPYHGAGQAEGLAFSVAPGVRVPPSLRNIFKEIQRDLGQPIPVSGSLVRWAQQGVLLLNTSLTVEEGQAASHAKRGWETLTDALIELVARQSQPVVFLLWGAPAQSKLPLILESQVQTDGPGDAAGPPRHVVLCSAHPSPLSAHRGFFGSRPFSATNAALQRMGAPPIDWSIPE